MVRGDSVLLAEGDRVPADATLHSVNDLQVDESLLTGESLAVEKRPGERAFSGTLVLKGQGRGEVFATGAATELARLISIGVLAYSVAQRLRKCT